MRTDFFHQTLANFVRFAVVARGVVVEFYHLMSRCVPACRDWLGPGVCLCRALTVTLASLFCCELQRKKQRGRELRKEFKKYEK